MRNNIKMTRKEKTSASAKAIAMIMAFTLFLGSLSYATVYAAMPRISRSKVTIIRTLHTTVAIKNTSKDVKWKTSNKKVAAIKKKGKNKAVITGIKPGRAVISGMIGKKAYKCVVTVKGAGLSKTRLSVRKGACATIKIHGGVKAKWSSSNSKVVKITTKTGRLVKVKGLKAGTATIRAKAGKKVYRCKVTVKGKAATKKNSKSNTKGKEKKASTRRDMTYEEYKKAFKKALPILRDNSRIEFQKYLKEADYNMGLGGYLGYDYYTSPSYKGPYPDCFIDVLISKFDKNVYYSGKYGEQGGYFKQYSPGAYANPTYGLCQRWDLAYLKYKFVCSKDVVKATYTRDGTMPTPNSPVIKSGMVVLNYNHPGIAIHFYDKDDNLVGFLYKKADKRKFQDYYIVCRTIEEVNRYDNESPAKYQGTRPDWKDATSTPRYGGKNGDMPYMIALKSDDYFSKDPYEYVK